MRVIGTAGHVDHGKSTLVEALTGVNPDRLKEEQQRQMTIDLGFAWLSLPGGQEVGIIDVPGHRDFIENMLAGVGGIDAALFVIAVDEGIMPQTREHLAILDLLEIRNAIIVLTKMDLISDPDWVDMVVSDIRKVFSGSVLENAPIVPVSARTGLGISDLKKAIQDMILQLPERKITGIPRLPIDRIFSIQGFGTIVTGTLMDGSLSVGDDVFIYPSMIKGKVRGLQTHKKKETMALPGSRTAVNVSGLEVDAVKRGDVLSLPDKFLPVRFLDVQFRLLKDSPCSLEHNMEAKLFIGSAEINARVRLLGIEKLEPGETGWLQLELVTPIVAVCGDRFILRRPSPGETLGGGRVADGVDKRHKRFDTDLLDHLITALDGSPEEKLLRILDSKDIFTFHDLKQLMNEDVDRLEQMLNNLVVRGSIVCLDAEKTSDFLKGFLITRDSFERMGQKISAIILAYHQDFPLRVGIPVEELKSRTGITGKAYQALMNTLVDQGKVRKDNGFYAMPDFQIVFSAHQKTVVNGILKQFEAAPYSPPSVKECQQALGNDLYRSLLDQGILIEASPEVVFKKEAYYQILEMVKEVIISEGEINVARVRDLLDTSRKYALAILEYFDQCGITLREGDVRKLKR